MNSSAVSATKVRLPSHSHLGVSGNLNNLENESPEEALVDPKVQQYVIGGHTPGNGKDA